MHSEYCNTLVLRPRLILNYKIFSIGIGIVIEFSKLRYWYWYLYWFSKSGVLVLKSVSISEIWNIEIDIGIETWFFRIKYWYWLIRAGIAHLWSISWSYHLHLRHYILHILKINGLILKLLSSDSDSCLVPHERSICI